MGHGTKGFHYPCHYPHPLQASSRAVGGGRGRGSERSLAAKKTTADLDRAPDSGKGRDRDLVWVFEAPGASKPTPDPDPDPPRTLPGSGALSGSGVGFWVATFAQPQTNKLPNVINREALVQRIRRLHICISVRGRIIGRRGAIFDRIREPFLCDQHPRWAPASPSPRRRRSP